MSEIIYPIVKFSNSAVYQLLFPNGKSYIGQSDDIRRRHKEYQYGKCKTQPKLYPALKKYGWNNITVNILVFSDQISIRLFWEKWYIMEFDSMRNGYNCTMGGEGTEGYIPTKETIQKMADGHRGIPKSKEARNRMSLASKGKPKSAEHVKNMSIAKSGKNHPMYGKPLSFEHRQKIANAKIGIPRSAETIRKMSESQKGRHVPMEIRLKMSASHKGLHPSAETIKKRSGKNNPMWGKRGADHPNFGRRHTTDELLRMSASLKGRIFTTEHLQKIAAGRKKYFAAKKLKQLEQQLQSSTSIILFSPFPDRFAPSMK